MRSGSDRTGEQQYVKALLFKLTVECGLSITDDFLWV